MHTEKLTTMIQRVQTLYLLGSLVLIVLMFFYPYAAFIDPSAVTYVFDFSGIHAEGGEELLQGVLPLQILLGVVAVLHPVVIFLFRNRTLQMRLTIFNMLLMAGILILAGWYIYYAVKEWEMQVLFRVSLLFPLMAILLSWLAFRNILKDELLVRSADRIR